MIVKWIGAIVRGYRANRLVRLCGACDDDIARLVRLRTQTCNWLSEDIRALEYEINSLTSHRAFLFNKLVAIRSAQWPQ